VAGDLYGDHRREGAEQRTSLDRLRWCFWEPDGGVKDSFIGVWAKETHRDTAVFLQGRSRGA
jgi:hypothetical protein